MNEYLARSCRVVPAVCIGTSLLCCARLCSAGPATEPLARLPHTRQAPQDHWTDDAQLLGTVKTQLLGVDIDHGECS